MSMAVRREDHPIDRGRRKFMAQQIRWTVFPTISMTWLANMQHPFPQGPAETKVYGVGPRITAAQLEPDGWSRRSQRSGLGKLKAPTQ